MCSLRRPREAQSTGLDRSIEIVLISWLTNILDTDAGPNFINYAPLLRYYHERIKWEPALSFRDANNNPLCIEGTIRLNVQVGMRMVPLLIWLTRGLAAPVIVGCHFCDKYIEAIQPMQLVKLDDGPTIPIIRKTGVPPSYRSTTGRPTMRTP